MAIQIAAAATLEQHSNMAVATTATATETTTRISSQFSLVLSTETRRECLAAFSQGTLNAAA